MNGLEAASDVQETFSRDILSKGDFRSPGNGGGAWNADQEHTGWQWRPAWVRRRVPELTTRGY